MCLPLTADLQASSDERSFNCRAQTINIVADAPKKWRSRVARSTTPDASNAAPPASANPSASGSETTRATRSCKCSARQRDTATLLQPLRPRPTHVSP